MKYYLEIWNASRRKDEANITHLQAPTFAEAKRIGRDFSRSGCCADLCRREDHGDYLLGRFIDGRFSRV